MEGEICAGGIVDGSSEFGVMKAIDAASLPTQLINSVRYQVLVAYYKLHELLST